jgi:SAM-dependent methyltransferase
VSLAPEPGIVLRTRSQAACPVCGSPGTVRYESLSDNLFGVAGSWTSRQCANADCGCLWLDPAPLEDDLGLAYQNYFTHVDPPAGPPSLARRLWHDVKQGYLSRRFGYDIPGKTWKRIASYVLQPFPTRRESLETLGLHLDPVPGGHVLEIGCGSGATLVNLHELGWRAEGLDFDPAAGALARARGLRVRSGGLADQGYPDHAFDAVGMVHAIEHIPDPLNFLREVRRVLAPNGQLVLITPNARARGLARFGASWLGLDAPRHVQVFTARALERVVREAGFRLEGVRTTARMAGYLHGEGRRIESGGTVPRDGITAADLWFQIGERLALLGDPMVGEELVLRARA